MSFDVLAIQKDLKAARLDGWLFYDFRGPRSHRAPHSGAASGHADATLVLFCAHKGRAAKTSA